MSFNDERITSVGLTFDDVLLKPGYSEVSPSETELKTKLTEEITLNIPILSAAMDTVTEAEMAIAIAREGGIGVLHKNMSIEDQARMVAAVKRAESGMIADPVTVSCDSTIGDALHLMEKFLIGGIPVIDDHGSLYGLVTNRDLRFEKDLKRPITEVMTSINDLIMVRQSLDLEQAEAILQKHRIEKLPVVDDANKLLGLVTYKDMTKAQDKPLACKNNEGRLRVAAAIGTTPDSWKRLEKLVEEKVDAIVIDTAHGHSKPVLDLLKRAKEAYPEAQIIVGNCATAEAARDLAAAGADGIKVGIGPGSICTTRVVAGIGVPQLTAIHNVRKGLAGRKIPIIADGGIRYSGDIAKALAAGADTIMAGGLFAGVDESPGQTIIYNGRKFKSYQGMGSLEAMQRGSKDRYFQEEVSQVSKLVPEGIAARVPYKGSLEEVVYQLIGGLRAGMGYCGAKSIADLHRAEFIKVTQAGVSESHPHDVAITSEAPNYSR